MRSLLIASVCLCVSGCIVDTIAESNPRPNTPFTAAEPQSLALILDSAIANDFSIPSKSHPDDPEWGMPVVGWRRTLTAGFRNGFAAYFKPAPVSGPADLSLNLVRADLGFSGGRAQIVYKAQLLDASGRTLAVTSGTAISKTVVTRWADGLLPESTCASDAVETLYEELATNLVRAAVAVDHR
jgi:hypothetical protein